MQGMKIWELKVPGRRIAGNPEICQNMSISFFPHASLKRLCCINQFVLEANSSPFFVAGTWRPLVVALSSPCTPRSFPLAWPTERVKSAGMVSRAGLARCYLLTLQCFVRVD